MKENDFDDKNIIKEVRELKNSLNQNFELLFDYLKLLTEKPIEPLTREKAEKDFSDMKEKLKLMNNKIADKHQD